MKKTVTRGIGMALGFVITTVALAFAAAWAGTGQPLALDSAHCYEGMNAPYAKGYQPEVRDGQAMIVLPLTCAEPAAMTDGPIEAWLEFGDAPQSPFIYASYHKDVPLETHKTTDGQEIQAYLACFSVPLKAQPTPGVYPVAVWVRYTPVGMVQPLEQHYPLYVTVEGPAATTSPSPEPAATPLPEAPAPAGSGTDGSAGGGGATTSQPKLILDRYASTPEAVMAGETATLQLTFLNTSDKTKIRNLSIDCLPESDDLWLADQKSTYYVAALGAGKTYELTLTVVPRLLAEGKPHRIRLALSYEDATGTPCTAEAFATVDVHQPIRLATDQINLPASIYSGDSTLVSMQVMNMGQERVYNVLCILEVPGMIAQSAAYLGNLESGAAQTAEILTVAGTLDMDGQGVVQEDAQAGKYGVTQGVMRMTYEDAYGQSYTEEIPVESAIEAPLYTTMANPLPADKETEGQGVATQWWTSVFVLAGLLIALAAVLSYRKKVQRLRRKYGDENL